MLVSSCVFSFCLGSLLCWERSLPWSSTCSLGPAQLTQALVTRACFPLPHYRELLPTFPTLRVVLYYLETPAAVPHTSGQPSWHCESQPSASQAVCHIRVNTDLNCWPSLRDPAHGPVCLRGRSACLPIADTCCWDPSVCQRQLGKVPTPVMPACSEMPQGHKRRLFWKNESNCSLPPLRIKAEETVSNLWTSALLLWQNFLLVGKVRQRLLC